MPESPELLARHRKALARHPQALAAIDGVAPYGEETIERSRAGDPIILLPGLDGVVRPLHSRYEPRREARSQLPEELEPTATVVILGAGLGYAPLALVERLTSENLLFWVEADPRLFRTLLGRVDVTALIEHPAVRIVVGAEQGTLFRALEEELVPVLSSRVHLVPHPASVQRQPAEYEDLRKAVSDFTSKGAVLVRTSLYLARFTLKNQCANLGEYMRSPGIAPLAGALRGKPAILVSAGPSLRRNVDLLRGAVGRIPIIAVSTALRALLGRGIVPDFTVLIDYHRISRRYFEGIDPAQAPPMVTETKANPEAIAAYPGMKPFANDLFLNTFLEGIYGDRGDLPSGSTVAHTAFHFACCLGADPIILVGQDLSYPGYLLHVPGTAVQAQEYPSTHRFYSLEMRELEYYFTHRKSFRKVPAIPDGEVPTDDIFFTYLKEFERYFEEHPGTVIDATEGGARIACTRVEPLAAVLARHAEEERPDVAAPVARARQEIPVDEWRDETLRLLELRRGDTEGLARLYDGMLEALEEVIARNERGEAADDETRRVHRLLDEARSLGRVYLLLSQLAQADAWMRMKADRRLDAEAPEGIERQRRQATRDRDYVRGLREAASFLLACLKRARSAAAAPARIPLPQEEAAL
ncbi:MAG: motility associated factor glycosyltransferase family protein [Planctomycetota bacterium]